MAFQPDRTMTVKRALTRLKTLKAQLGDNIDLIQQYGAWSSMKKHPLGIPQNDSTTVTIKQTIDAARTKVQSTYQSTEDLLEEYSALLKALAITNLATSVTVADKTMTIYEALMYKKYIKDFYNKLVQANSYASNKADREVDNYNQRNTAEDANGNKIEANVVYFLPTETLQGYKEFNSKFVEELNGAIDESNIKTELVWEFPVPCSAS